MLNQNNPFETGSGSDRITNIRNIGLILTVIIISAWLISKMGIVGAVALLLLPVVSVFFFLLFRYPILGLYSALIYSFFVLGIGKYISGVQFGIFMDGILILTYIALIFNKFEERVNWSPVIRDITLLSTLWFAYILLQLVNPEAKSMAAWTTGRGFGLYIFLIIPLTLLFIDSNKKLDTLLIIWATLSLLATIKGIIQIRFGADQWEQAWLNEGNFKTHVLYGKLRAFSFMSDAGQFGANQGYSAVMALIVASAQKNIRRKIFFIVVGAFALYGLVISGTRGALAVPVVGFATFFVMRKNKWIMFSGFIALVVVFVFFKYTSIGQGNANIRRMRTAFDPNDASLQVRLANQRILKSYMASRPFGGGLGHGGVKAQRFLPNAFLSQVPTDSGYVLVWVELGVVGLALHLFMLFYVLIKGSFRIMFRIRDPDLKIKMAALASGMAGIVVANYGNSVFSQMPTFMLMSITMALLMNSDVLDSAEPGLNVLNKGEEKIELIGTEAAKAISEY
jgi:hypothetical protein